MEKSVPGDFGQINDIPSTSPAAAYSGNIPAHLHASMSRLQFTPSYVVVGVYRLFTDKTLARPAWDKCKHGLVRGATVALVWVRHDPPVSPGQHL